MLRVTPWLGCAALLASACTRVASEAGPACATSQFDRRLGVYGGGGRLNVLLVVDASPSMAPHVARLRDQLPRLFAELNSGRSDNPVFATSSSSRCTDLHVGVVSADLGVGAAAESVQGCSARGEDAILHGGASCGTPDNYVWYYENYHSQQATLSALTCQLQLGSSCAVAQPLEAALRAVWPPLPSAEPKPDAGVLEPIPLGHADRENSRFLRPAEFSPELLVIIMTDKDDCSAPDHTFVTGPADQSGAADSGPLRCAQHSDRLFAVQRYVDGLRNSRAGHVLVALIAAIPPDLVSHERQTELSFAAGPTEFYAGVLNDPRMQLGAAPNAAAPDPRDAPCAQARAAGGPARRLIKLAAQLGDDARVQSLCDDDLTQAAYRLLSGSNQSRVRADCWDQQPARDAAGLVQCRVVWELPTEHDPERPLTPTACSERPDFLSVPAPQFSRFGEHGGALCDLRQLPVLTQDNTLIEASGDGFYLDDFSTYAQAQCAPSGVLVKFTKRATPSEGIWMTMQCSSSGPRRDSGSRAVPSIGAACHRVAEAPQAHVFADDALCQPGRVVGKPASVSIGMFCHPDQHICLRECRSSDDCPAGWVCDEAETALARSAGRPTCVNPSCED